MYSCICTCRCHTLWHTFVRDITVLWSNVSFGAVQICAVQICTGKKEDFHIDNIVHCIEGHPLVMLLVSDNSVMVEL